MCFFFFFCLLWLLQALLELYQYYCSDEWVVTSLQEESRAEHGLPGGWKFAFCLSYSKTLQQRLKLRCSQNTNVYMVIVILIVIKSEKVCKCFAFYISLLSKILTSSSVKKLFSKLCFPKYRYISITHYWSTSILVFFLPLQAQFEFPPAFPDRHATKRLERVLHVLVHNSENNGFCLSVADQKTEN